MHPRDNVAIDIVGIIMKVASIGAFGAMAFTIGKYGIGSLFSLGKLMGFFYLTCLIFVFAGLGLIGAKKPRLGWSFRPVAPSTSTALQST